MKFPLLFLLLATSAHAVLIPADRLFNWTPGLNVGVEGGIPHRTTPAVAVTGADPTGVNDSSVAIQTAINNCPSGGVVLIPAGTFKISVATLQMKGNITVRGAGRETTILKSGGPGVIAFQNLGQSGTSGYFDLPGDNDLTAGFAKGSTVITVDDTTPFTVGGVVEMRKFGSTVQTDNPILVATSNYPGSSNYVPGYKQKSKITAKTATTLTIFPPVLRDMNVPNTRVVVGGMIHGPNWGIEDLTLDNNFLHPVTAGVLTPSINFWFRNVRIRGALNKGLAVENGVFYTIRDCYVEPIGVPGQSNGSGIDISACSFGLIENNIVIDVFPCIEVNHGASGNVFGYNYLRFFTPGLHAIMSNHNTHNFMNLYEGNVANGIVSDGNWGSASNDVVFRNWLHGDVSSYGVQLNRFTRQYSLVGNVIGGPTNDFNVGGDPYNGIRMGTPNMGNPFNNGRNAPPWAEWGIQASLGLEGANAFQEFDPGVESTTIQKGNYTFRTDNIPAAQALGADTLPNSYYLTAKPAWFGNLAWPPVDSTNSAALAPFDDIDNGPGTKTINDISVKIPAGFYYVNGVYPTSAPDTTAPTLVSKTITAAGTTITFAFNENVAIGLGGNGGWTINMTGGAATLTYASGSGSSNLIYNISRVIAAGQTGTVSYVQPGNGVEDVAGNDLASLSNSAVTNTAAGDTTAPTPNPSTFGIAPTALTSSTITMTATTAVDAATPPVQYFFNEVSGNAGGSDSGWQSSPTFLDAGLAAGTQYRYRVQTRDSAVPPNVTTFSTEASATTKSVAGAHPAAPFKLARANIVTP